MKGRVVEINIKTGERKEYIKEFPKIIEPIEEPKGINFEKLKQLLLDKNLIQSKEEIE